MADRAKASSNNATARANAASDGPSVDRVLSEVNAGSSRSASLSKDNSRGRSSHRNNSRRRRPRLEQQRRIHELESRAEQVPHEEPPRQEERQPEQPRYEPPAHVVEQPRAEEPRVDAKQLLDDSGLVMIETDRSKAPAQPVAMEDSQPLGRPRRERPKPQTTQEDELVQIETTTRK